MPALDQKQIASIGVLKARGVSDNDIARVIGVTPEEMQRHLRDPVVISTIATHSGNVKLKELQNDDKWDKIEGLALDAVSKDLEGNSSMFDPNALVNLARIANAAKRRHGAGSGPKSGEGQPGVIQGNSQHVTVQIALPGALMQHLKARVEGHEAGTTRQAVSADRFDEFANQHMGVKEVEKLLNVDSSRIMPGGANFGASSEELLAAFNRKPETEEFDPTGWDHTGTIGG